MATALGSDGHIIPQIDEYDRYQPDLSWQPCQGGCSYIHARITDLKLEGEKIETEPRHGCVMGNPPKEEDVRRIWNRLVERIRRGTWGEPKSLQTAIRAMEKVLDELGIY